MKIGVVGGRHRIDKEIIIRHLTDFIRLDDMIVSGGAKGVDTMAKDFALKKCIAFHEITPCGDLKSPKAYHERNQKIVDNCDVLLAFPSIDSHGTWDTIHRAREAGKRIIIFKEVR